VKPVFVATKSWGRYPYESLSVKMILFQPWAHVFILVIRMCISSVTVNKVMSASIYFSKLFGLQQVIFT